MNMPCKYDPYYPCYLGCDNVDCEWYEDDEEEQDQEDEEEE